MPRRAPDYCGWGAKQGSKVRTWKNRYFVLRGRELIYYSSAKSDGSGAGVGEKGRLRVVNVDYSPDRKNGLFIHGEGRSLKMTTASAQESRVLFKRIKQAIGEQERSFRQELKTAAKEGWLLKEDTLLRSWKRRFVTLQGQQITFYADASQNAAALETQVVVKAEEVKTSPLCLTLVVKSGKEIHVAAETRGEIQEWDRTIAKAIEKPVALSPGSAARVPDNNQEGDHDARRKYSTAVCEGWLEKLGQRSKTWKKRYVSLSNGMLEYRKGPMEQLSAELFVTDVRYSSEYLDALEIEFGSKVPESGRDSIYMRAQSIRELDKWMSALCDTIGKPRLENTHQLSSSYIDGSDDERLSKPQLPPFPRNASKSGAASTTQPSTPVQADRSSGQQDVLVSGKQIFKRGWLFKQGHRTTSWKLRYFVLDGNTLHLFKHINSSPKTLGVVASVTRSQEPVGALCVQFEDESALKMYGETKADTDAWFGALCNASWSSAENPTERMSGFNQEEEDFHDDNCFQGWLLKKGQNFKTWKRRYFVLEQSRLAYSSTDGGEVLGSGMVFEVEVGDLRPFCLSIRFQNGRLLHVVAPTQESFGKWFDVLRRASNLSESFILQSQGKAVLEEEFDNDVIDDNANDAEVGFTEDDLAEYEKSIRASEGAALWLAAMNNEPEFDALSSSTSERVSEELEDMDSFASEEIPQISDAASMVNEARGCVGWLKKEGGNVKSWKRRYFTLFGTKLSYYKSEKGSLLRSCNITSINKHPSISLGLAVSTVGGRTLIMQASTQEEYERWFAAIQAAVAGENGRKTSVGETNKVAQFEENGPITDKATVLTSYSGWLEKEGQRFKTWKRRYFTVKNSALIYYNEIGGVARGHGLVRSAHLDESKPLTIVIEFRSGKTMRVTAPNEAEETVWLQVLSRDRSSSSKMTDVSDDVVDSEEEEDEDDASRLKNLDSNDYFTNDTIGNDTFMRLQEQDGKTTFMHSTNGRADGTQHLFKGELNFDEEDEVKEDEVKEEETKADFGVSTTGADFYRQLVAEEERVQAQRKSEQLSHKEEPPIAGCAPCCIIM
ncbi:hypothetical protein PHYBOEH_009426 [Phytophthora boehmeriae]|uniref:PH domain-containing protein n=1 Tax=Phytophthora boehmeriae TaxID=109152 RepID=A0A8T1VTJ9_9STRA|nr:hypothetical protein PHYBOEH_009426 [Phytophthora boehmeriae]